MSEVDAVEVVPLFVGLLVERLAGATEVTDVVHQHVDPAELVASRRNQRFGHTCFPYVDHSGHRPPAVAGDRELGLAGAFGVDLHDHDRGTLTAKRDEIPRPIPPPPPVTIATFPASRSPTAGT